MKKSITVDELKKHFFDGMTIMVGGFLNNASPAHIIDAIIESGVKDITLIANDTSYPDRGCGRLIEKKLVKKLIASHIGTNPLTGQQMNEGTLEVEFSPQGTLAERIRAAGAGLGGVLTRTGLATDVEKGKEKITVDGKEYLLEKPLHADFAFLQAQEGDEMGNLVFKGTAQNFQPLMAMAADKVAVEIEHLVPAGKIAAEAVHVPSILVTWIVK